jgi:hypothetical protein
MWGGMQSKTGDNKEARAPFRCHNLAEFLNLMSGIIAVTQREMARIVWNSL